MAFVIICLIVAVVVLWIRYGYRNILPTQAAPPVVPPVPAAPVVTVPKVPRPVYLPDPYNGRNPKTALPAIARRPKPRRSPPVFTSTAPPARPRPLPVSPPLVVTSDRDRARRLAQEEEQERDRRWKREATRDANDTMSTVLSAIAVGASAQIIDSIFTASDTPSSDTSTYFGGGGGDFGGGGSDSSW